MYLFYHSKTCLILFIKQKSYQNAILGKASPSQLRLNIWIVIGDKDKLGLYFPSDIKTTYGTDRRYSIRSQLYFVDKKSNQLTQVLGRGSSDLKFQVKERLFISNINIANQQKATSIFVVLQAFTHQLFNNL